MPACSTALTVASFKALCCIADKTPTLVAGSIFVVLQPAAVIMTKDANETNTAFTNLSIKTCILLPF
jgi:hypothetical protein